jgi:AraC-like DNA-binding protein
MDVLTDVLQSLRLRSRVYGRAELTAPWGMRFDSPGDPHPILFVVSRGSCWLEVDGTPGQLPLSGGDFVLLPQGGPCSLRDQPETPAIPIQQILAQAGKLQCDRASASSCVFQYGGGGVPVSLISGCLEFENPSASPLVESLPPMIHIKGDQGEPVQWLASTLQFLAAESASTLPGAEAVRNHLADILFVQAIRAHIAANGRHPPGWLRALADPDIGKTLRDMHERPDKPWTVESLAAGVALSRSAFASRFRALVGIPPLTYLTRWRMHKAAQLLRHENTSLAHAARTVGYRAESSFGKAFKRQTGSAPGEFRAALKSRRKQVEA